MLYFFCIIMFIMSGYVLIKGEPSFTEWQMYVALTVTILCGVPVMDKIHHYFEHLQGGNHERSSNKDTNQSKSKT